MAKIASFSKHNNYPTCVYVPLPKAVRYNYNYSGALPYNNVKVTCFDLIVTVDGYTLVYEIKDTAILKVLVCSLYGSSSV